MAVRFVSKQTPLGSSKTKSLCQGLPYQGSCRADARLRGWTKDAFRVSGITQVLLCTTSPTSSLRSMPPPLVGEALAFRDVFQQTQIGFIENEISLPRAPLIGKTPPAGGGGTEVPKGERLRGFTSYKGCTPSRASLLLPARRGRRLSGRPAPRPCGCQ